MLYLSRLRSYLGYPSVRDALPNTTHFALAALQYTSFVPRIITQVIINRLTQSLYSDHPPLLQNVDGLHQKALRQADWSPTRIQDAILELHGTLRVRYVRFSFTYRRLDLFVCSGSIVSSDIL